MAARTLVQALEGVSFPCDRSTLIEYARRNNIAPRAMEALQEIPEGQYRDMTQLFTALPAKHEVGKRRSNVTSLQAQPQPAQEAKGQEREEEEEEEEEEEAPPEARNVIDWARDDMPMPDFGAYWPQVPWQQGLMPLEMAAQWSRAMLECWPQFMRLGQRLWFPWLR